MKDGKVPFNLSVAAPLADSMKVFVAGSRRKGQRTVSEITENLWVSFLRRKGVKLPPLMKEAK
jgi:hypothetical protein